MLETIPLALAAVVALLLGRRLQHRIEVELYQKILRGLLLILALTLLVQFFGETGLVSHPF